jgi:hypothetical protein
MAQWLRMTLANFSVVVGHLALEAVAEVVHVSLPRDLSLSASAQLGSRR